VFSSLGLIKKTCLESKKPAYTWIGLSGLDSFIERLNSCTDEKDIFVEPSSTKNKEQPRPVYDKKVFVGEPSSVQPPKALPKLESSQPIISNDTLETLLCTLLNLYKMQQPPSSSQEDIITALQQKSSMFQTPKLAKQISSPHAGFERSGMGLVTPNIRRSVSILVNFYPLILLFIFIS